VRVLVTGATGFVGRWLVQELEAFGHDVIAAPSSAELDIGDAAAVRRLVTAASPDAVAHLAAVAFAPDAARDPDRAFAVNEGGTRAILEAVASTDPGTHVLVTSSSEVYGRPAPEDLPIDESHALRPDRPYGRSKLAQEKVASEIALMHGIPLVLTRAFNHTGPGQRTDFVVPALAARILDAVRDGGGSIRAGNVDVRRDIGDVRDVVRAYRLLLEASARRELPAGPSVFNIATGQAVAIREVIERLAAVAGTTVEIETDPALVRPDDPPEIRGDATRLREAIAWNPEWPLSTTLADVLASVARS
jgi:GDP-4-dehydro-6-deoxy-D-mannose reductase